MRISSKLVGVLLCAGVLAALSPAPNLVPESARIHTRISSSGTNFESAQSLARSQGEVGYVSHTPRQRQAIKNTDMNAAYNLKLAQNKFSHSNAVQAAAAIREAEQRVSESKRSPLAFVFWLVFAGVFGYGLIFLARRWADKNIPSPRSARTHS